MTDETTPDAPRKMRYSFDPDKHRQTIIKGIAGFDPEALGYERALALAA